MKPPFEQVITEHSVAVLRVARAMLPLADADDAWSETFLSALEAYPRLPDDASIGGWIVTIAHRKAIDMLRAGQRTMTVDVLPERIAPSAEPDLDLRRALAALPERQRACVVLHHLGGLPFAEVATVEGCSPAAARRASADGIRALRTTLSADGGLS